jgi:hypothetical protein
MDFATYAMAAAPPENLAQLIERNIGFDVANASTLAGLVRRQAAPRGYRVGVSTRLNFLQPATGRADIDILGS